MNSLQTSTTSPTHCPDRQLLILDAVRPEWLSKAVREQLFEHLCLCAHCAARYEKICDADRELADVSPDLISDAALKATRFMTQEQSLEDIWRRIEAIEAQSQRDHRRKFIFRIGKTALAMAACLLMAVGIFRWNAASLPVGDSPDSQPAPSATAVSPRRENQVGNERFDSPIWILQAQAALRTRGIEADCLDLLMISSDFRQFSFDPAASFSQPLAVYQPSSLQRLAQHFGIPLEVPQGDQRTVRSSASPPPARESSERWRSALAAAETAPGRPTANLLLFSLRACNHLAQNHAAAAAWVRKHSAEADLLLASAEYRSACEVPDCVHDAQGWSRLLDDHAMAANRCLRAISELSQMPALDRCALTTNENWRQLKQCVGKLLSPETGRRNQ